MPVSARCPPGVPRCPRCPGTRGRLGAVMREKALTHVLPPGTPRTPRDTGGTPMGHRGVGGV